MIPNRPSEDREYERVKAERDRLAAENAALREENARLARLRDMHFDSANERWAKWQEAMRENGALRERVIEAARDHGPLYLHEIEALLAPASEPSESQPFVCFKTGCKSTVSHTHAIGSEPAKIGHAFVPCPIPRDCTGDIVCHHVIRSRYTRGLRREIAEWKALLARVKAQAEGGR